ncbi:hypothetical protein FRC03_003941 [Tulasnella sp. 419]|nr:hypothetical protein FRC03_003941 [Tulasnella sp. 419]
MVRDVCKLQSGQNHSKDIAVQDMEKSRNDGAPSTSNDKGKQRAEDEKPLDPTSAIPDQKKQTVKYERHFLLRRWPKLPSSEDIWTISEEERAILNSIEFGRLTAPIQPIHTSPPPKAQSPAKLIELKSEPVSPSKETLRSNEQPNEQFQEPPKSTSPDRQLSVESSGTASRGSPDWDVEEEDPNESNDVLGEALSEHDGDSSFDQASNPEVEAESRADEDVEMMDDEVISQGRISPQPEQLPSPKSSPLKQFQDSSGGVFGTSQQSSYPPLSNPGPVAIVLVPDSDTSMNQHSQSQSQSQTQSNSQPFVRRFINPVESPVINRVVDSDPLDNINAMATQALSAAPDDVVDDTIAKSELLNEAPKSDSDEILSVPPGQLVVPQDAQAQSDHIKVKIDPDQGSKQNHDVAADSPHDDEGAHLKEEGAEPAKPNRSRRSPSAITVSTSNRHPSSKRSLSRSPDSRNTRPRSEDDGAKNDNPRRSKPKKSKKSTRRDTSIPGWIRMMDDRPSQIDPWTQPSFLQKPKVRSTATKTTNSSRRLESNDRQSASLPVNSNPSMSRPHSVNTEELNGSNIEVPRIKEEPVQISLPPVPSETSCPPLSDKALGGFSIEPFILTERSYGRASLISWEDIAVILERARTGS